MKCGLGCAAAAVALFLASGSIFADAGHGGSKSSFGSPGVESAVTKVVKVEANDHMRFVFDRTDISRGDVVKFVVRNTGKVRHEFSIGDAASQRAHAAMMRKMPGMVHHDPNMLTLEPGETKTLIWRFDRPLAGKIVFACHEPGHNEAGMNLQLALKK